MVSNVSPLLSDGSFSFFHHCTCTQQTDFTLTYIDTHTHTQITQVQLVSMPHPLSAPPTYLPFRYPSDLSVELQPREREVVGLVAGVPPVLFNTDVPPPTGVQRGLHLPSGSGTGRRRGAQRVKEGGRKRRWGSPTTKPE